MRKMISVLLLAAVLLCVCAGCQKESNVVRLAEVTHSVFYAPLYAAIELGYFEAQGITIELTNAGGADKAMAMLLSGQTDIGFMGPEAAVYVHKEGRQDAVKVFGQLTIRDGQFLVGRDPDDHFTWDALRGKAVIAGRRGGVPCMTFEHLLREQGLIPGEDVNVRTDIQFDLLGGAFAGGEADYVTLFEPTATQAALQGYGYILASVGADAGPVAYTCFMAPQSTIKNKSDMLTRFLTALYEGQKFVQTHSAKEVAEAIAPAFPDNDIETLIPVVERYVEIGAWTLNPMVNKESIESLQTIMIEAGELDEAVSFDDFVDNSIAQKVSK